ncbi:ribose-phosphate diphosphokinase [Lactobacillus selangorensis]|nr:ribose-phosphate pyrophosphokinase [Lactobacillus selangorensis]
MAQLTQDAPMQLFALNGNRPLAEKIAQHMGIPLSKTTIQHFADGEIQVNIVESVRGAEAYVIQPTSDPVNENFMELMIMVDALRRASAKSINVVMPYYGYSRADRKARSREPITAKLVANLLSMDGIDRLIALDLHADQLQGFFDIPVDHLRAMPIQAKYLMDHNIKGHDVVVVAPQHSNVKDARKLAEFLDSPIAIVDKRASGKTYVIGDVEGKTCVILDDMIDTGNRVVYTTEALKDAGAKDIYACATHAIFSAGATDRLKAEPLKKIIVTDSIQIPEDKQLDNLVQLSVAQLFAAAIERIHSNRSVDDLFKLPKDYTMEG